MNFKFILLIPILEIFAFILFGDFFGFFPVIFFIIFTGVLGLILIKSNLNLNKLEDLVKEPNEWVYKKIAGILLLIPGFVTDFLGLVMLIKTLRSFVWRLIISKSMYQERNKKKDKDIIEVEYKDLDEK